MLNSEPRRNVGSGFRLQITDLLRACLVLLRVPADLATIYQPRPPPFWLMSDAIARIQAMIAELPDGGTLSTFLPRIDAKAPDRERRCRAAVASTLLAGLELARQGNVALDQEVPWATIALHPPRTVVADREAEV